MNERSPIDSLKGIGEKTKVVFEKAGIFNVGDLLHYYPRNYDVFEDVTAISDAVEETMVCICAVIERTITVRYVKKLQIAATTLKDQSGTIAVRWFRMPYLKNTLKPGGRYIFRGRVSRKGQQLLLEQPAVFDVSVYLDLKGTLQPLYPLTKGLTNNMISKAVRQAISELDLEKEILPAHIRSKYQLAEYHFALEQIHFPQDRQSMMLARHRLVFDEFFLFILALRNLKENRTEVTHSFEISKLPLTDQVIADLDFALTGAQRKVWAEIEADLTAPRVMSRLIQGDVGSGKTILAVLALILVAANGLQGCLMVPTEVLARQHFESITALFTAQGLSYQAVLLTGSMTAKEKRAAYEQIESGQADVIIGTHALIQEKVNYHNLALVVTDEQHRFGVKQREALAEKGQTPHTIVMSATPIPRTLAVILYGDLDISVVDELPANRLAIKNCVVGISYRPKAYTFIRDQVAAGRQAYVICPMVEESEAIEAENVIEYTERMQEALPPEVVVTFLHGKMKPKEKNEIMERFLRNQIQVLVSTTVVEVGVNVPNATVMVIENAERFGLAQLHQLRGRVGRGRHQSYCIMVYGSDNKKTKKRLEILNKSNDGFFIASEDLKLRGPGDLFGIRQSGLMDFKIGDVFQDAGVLQEASEAVGEILDMDAELADVSHRRLQQRIHDMTSGRQGNINL